jgi:hypothetical protein
MRDDPIARVVRFKTATHKCGEESPLNIVRRNMRCRSAAHHFLEPV